jgi:chromosome segregation ATPase
LKQQVQQLKGQLEQVQSRLDETSWTLCQKSGEMALLKSQLKEAQNEQSQRCQEMAKMRAQLKESQELAHNTRQRLEQAMTHQKPLDNRRSITSPILSGRKLIGEPEQQQHNGSSSARQFPSARTSTSATDPTSCKYTNYKTTGRSGTGATR